MQVLGGRCSPRLMTARIAVSSCQHQIADTRLPTPDCRHQIADTRLPTPDCRHQIADTRLPTPDCPRVHNLEHEAQAGKQETAVHVQLLHSASSEAKMMPQSLSSPSLSPSRILVGVQQDTPGTDSIPLMRELELPPCPDAR